jgi:hypothetical protein
MCAHGCARSAQILRDANSQPFSAKNFKGKRAENGLINRADASKISGINILSAFCLDTELLPIKIAATPFATVSNGVAEFYLAVFDSCSLSGLRSLRCRGYIVFIKNRNRLIGHERTQRSQELFLFVFFRGYSFILPALIPAQNNPWAAGLLAPFN